MLCCGGCARPCQPPPPPLSFLQQQQRQRDPHGPAQRGKEVYFNAGSGPLRLSAGAGGGGGRGIWDAPRQQKKRCSVPATSRPPSCSLGGAPTTSSLETWGSWDTLHAQQRVRRCSVSTRSPPPPGDPPAPAPPPVSRRLPQEPREVVDLQPQDGPVGAAVVIHRNHGGYAHALGEGGGEAAWTQVG